MTPVARAVVDTCRSMTDLSAVRALMAEAVQRRKATVTELAREIDLGPSRGSRLPRQVLAEVADGVRSAAEGASRAVIKRAGLPDPLWNPDLFTVDGRWIARPDAWWPREGVVLEIDSRQFHLSPEDWERTLQRHEQMTAYGILVVHVAPRRFMTAPQEVTDAIWRTLGQGRLRPPLPITTVPPPGWSARPR